MSRVFQAILGKSMLVLLFAAAVFAGGIWATSRLNVELMPSLDFPVLTIITPYPGASAEDVSKQVSEPVEQVVAASAGLEKLSSRSTDGLSIVVAQFRFGTDVRKLESDLDGSMRNIKLPDGAQSPRISRIDFNQLPVVQLSLYGAQTPADLEKLARDTVVPEFSKIDGVYSVDVVGGQKEEISVELDPAKAAAHGISLQQIQGILQANNLAVPSGSLDLSGQSVPVRTAHQFNSLSEVGDLVVGQDRGGSQIAGGGGQPGQAGTPAAPGGAPSAQGQGQPVAPNPTPNTGSAQTSGNPTPAPASPTAQAPTYTVKPGDNLSKIASQFGTTVNALTQANGIANPDLIYPDQVLTIPSAGPASTGNYWIYPQVTSQNGTPDQSQPQAGVVHLRDVATISVQTAASSSIARTNGQPGILLLVTKSPDSNAVNVANLVIQKSNDLAGKLPQGVKLDVIVNDSSFVQRSINGLVREGLLGAVFAIVVILAFLRSMRSTLIAALSIPLSILAALLVHDQATFSAITR